MGKKKKVKEQAKSEFRKLHTKEEKGHLHYVAKRKGKNYQSVGITHGKRTKGVTNIPLDKNPNPNDAQRAYVRPVITERNAKDYGKKEENCAFSPFDKKTVEDLIKRLLEEQNKPKK